MRFLANENFPHPSIAILRNAGLEIASVCDLFPGISDSEVIKNAQNSKSIILTFDKDYGEIIFRLGITFPPPVIFFRFKGNNPEVAGKLLLRLIESKAHGLDNSFTVVELDNIRQRKYS